MENSGDHALTKLTSQLPLDVTSVLPALSEPMRHLYKAQLEAINMIDHPEMIEAQTDLVLEYLDDAIVSAKREEIGRIARTGALLMTYQLFLAHAYVVFQKDGSQGRLNEAVEDFASKLANDMCIGAAEAGKTLNSKEVIEAILGAARKRFEQDGEAFFKKAFNAMFGLSRAEVARRAYLDAAFRAVAKVARRAYFRGNGRHLVDFLKRHEADIVDLAVARSRPSFRERFTKLPDSWKFLSSGMLAWAWLVSFLPAMAAVAGSIYLTGLGESFWGYAWRVPLWLVALMIVGATTQPFFYRWAVKRMVENRLRRIYRRLEGKSVLVGHA